MQLGSHQFFSPGHEGLVKYWCKCVLGHEGEDLLAKLKYCCISALDQEGEDLLAKLKQHDVHSFMDDARREGGVVLVHCYVSLSFHLLRWTAGVMPLSAQLLPIMGKLCWKSDEDELTSI